MWKLLRLSVRNNIVIHILEENTVCAPRLLVEEKCDLQALVAQGSNMHAQVCAKEKSRYFPKNSFKVNQFLAGTGLGVQSDSSA